MIQRVMRWFGFHVHSWSKWQTRSVALRRWGTGEMIESTEQFRVCESCGYQESEGV